MNSTTETCPWRYLNSSKVKLLEVGILDGKRFSSSSITLRGISGNLLESFIGNLLEVVILAGNDIKVASPRVFS
jgi:hypothetical protein